MNRKTAARHLHPLWFGGLALLVAALACNLPGQATTPNATLTALSESVLRTATAGAGEEGSSSDTLATAEAEATARSQTVGATGTAMSSSRDEGSLVTATVVAPVVAELPFYNVDPAQGRLGWLHDPVDITLEGYHTMDFANDYMGVVAKDFVLAADVIWDTQYGASGCGFMFRSNGDQNNPDQYMVIASRFGGGHVAFMALADGQPANMRDFYPKTEDRSFSAENGSTNRLAVVGRGPIIEIYTNQAKVGEVDTTQPPPAPSLPARPKLPEGTLAPDILQRFQNQAKEYDDVTGQMQSQYQQALKNFSTTEAVFDQGFVAMLALSESGRTQCKFENAWLWLIEP